MEKIEIPWKEIPSGVLHRAMGNFLKALGDNAGNVVTQIVIDPRFVSDLATFTANLVSSGNFAPITIRQIRRLKFR